MRVTRLEGRTLDFWVAKSAGLSLLADLPGEGDGEVLPPGFWHPALFRPSANWSQGGPIVAEEWFDLETVLIEWFGPHWPYVQAVAAAPLTWFMRAFVATRFGDQVEELVEMPTWEAGWAEAHLALADAGGWGGLHPTTQDFEAPLRR